VSPRLLTLPLHPLMRADDVDYVCEHLLASLDDAGARATAAELQH
jgi:hypothetical protein